MSLITQFVERKYSYYIKRHIMTQMKHIMSLYVNVTDLCSEYSALFS